jgi:hypothetical protein
MEPTQSKPMSHPGSCHCGAVRFTVEVDTSRGSRCNCRVCTKLGMTTGIVKPEAFTLLSGAGELGAHGNEVGHRFFCSTCGAHCFARGHLEQLGGDFVSVNFNCLDDLDPRDVTLIHWDGRHDNWQAGPRDRPWPIFTAG